jgi:hypothetical protein
MACVACRGRLPRIRERMPVVGPLGLGGPGHPQGRRGGQVVHPEPEGLPLLAGGRWWAGASDRRGERALSARVWQPMQRRPGVARGGSGRAASPSLPPGGAGLAGEAVMLSLFQELGDSLAGQVGVQGRIHWAASLAGDIRMPYRQGSRQAA